VTQCPVDMPRPQSPSAPPHRTRSGIGAPSRLGLGIFFWLSAHARWALRLIKPLGVWLAVRSSAGVRDSTAANARRIYGAGLSDARCRAFAGQVVGQFYDFVVDVARSRSMTAGQIRQRIESISGREAYLAHRHEGGGAIIVTAHMGSFEVGLAALADVEPHIHVVFKRDAMGGFEALRRSLHETLGIHEAPIDDGWGTWMRLREALKSNHVVVMQGDRAMPGQKAQRVPVLGGHLMLPLGPVKLAQISGAKIVPVFTVRSPTGRCRVFAEAPIRVDPDAELVNGVHPALLEWGKVIEKFVAEYPEQWLVLGPAFVEDTPVAAPNA
jgi:lauroyl/myristoyl acyltransferase